MNTLHSAPRYTLISSNESHLANRSHIHRDRAGDIIIHIPHILACVLEALFFCVFLAVVMGALIILWGVSV